MGNEIRGTKVSLNLSGKSSLTSLSSFLSLSPLVSLHLLYHLSAPLLFLQHVLASSSFSLQASFPFLWRPHMAALSPRVNVNSELQGSKTINNSLSFSSSSSQEGILLASGATESVSLGWQPLPDLVSHNGNEWGKWQVLPGAAPTRGCEQSSFSRKNQSNLVHQKYLVQPLAHAILRVWVHT